MGAGNVFAVAFGGRIGAVESGPPTRTITMLNDSSYETVEELCLNRTDCSETANATSWPVTHMTTVDQPLADVTLENLALALLLFSFCGATVFGNFLVIVAVARERYLHTVTNYFITSLAVADLLVGSIVMPFSAANQLLDQWIFGQDLCDVWHSFDVLASTASILNLCIISMDRYWAIDDPFTYPGRMTPRRACCFIGLVWVCSSLISFPAIAWWRAVAEPSPPQPLLLTECNFTDDVGYIVFSSIISFYGPLLVMVFTYYRIYRAAVAQSQSLRLGMKQVVSEGGHGDVELTLRMHRGGNRRPKVDGHNQTNSFAMNAATPLSVSRESLSRLSAVCVQVNGVDAKVAATGDENDSSAVCAPTATGSLAVSSNSTGTPKKRGPSDTSASGLLLTPDAAALMAAAVEATQRPLPMAKMNFSLSRKLAKIAKERKAAKTLGIVMGVFIACWLPFFVTNLLSGICLQCIHNPQRVFAVVTWLGWINSAMNPVIYACWSRDFRRAFARILCACCPQLFHRWKRHSAKANHKGNVPGILTTPSPMTGSLSYSSLCPHTYAN